jgi:hypothetical protein
MPSATWLNHFHSHPNREAGNMNTEAFTTVWAQTTSNTTKITTLTNDKGLAVLTLDGNNNVNIFHNFKNFSGTLINPTNKYGCFQAAVASHRSSLPKKGHFSSTSTS